MTTVEFSSSSILIHWEENIEYERIVSGKMYNLNGFQERNIITPVRVFNKFPLKISKTNFKSSICISTFSNNLIFIR